ncbi:hypothetical protein CPB86DRAFT_787163 [Serendipita vermifera]|nr:hypothetical protein CPB86DRAFT_787163 [Serendipita vermifera]
MVGLETEPKESNTNLAKRKENDAAALQAKQKVISLPLATCDRDATWWLTCTRCHLSPEPATPRYERIIWSCKPGWFPSNRRRKRKRPPRRVQVRANDLGRRVDRG